MRDSKKAEQRQLFIRTFDGYCVAPDVVQENGFDTLPPAVLEENGFKFSTVANILNNVDDSVIVPTYRVNNMYVVVLMLSIIFYIVDLASDLMLAYQYHLYGHYNYAKLTLSFIFIPSFINTFVSIRMYFLEKEPVSYPRWGFRVTFLSLMMAPFVRYVEALEYAIKIKLKRDDDVSPVYETYYRNLMREDSSLSFLRIIECFLEAAPQQVMQIAILLHSENIQENQLFLMYQYVSLLTSLISIAWTCALYNRSVRFSREDRNNLTWTGSFVQFIWLFFLTTSRILTISEIGSVFPDVTVLCCVSHWAVMTVWLVTWSPTWFCYATDDETIKIAKPLEIMFDSVLAAIYIFIYIPSTDGNNQFKYAFYYAICFVENCAAMFFWSVNSEHIIHYWWFLPLLIITVIMFISGIIMMMVYYKYFHPRVLDDNQEIALPNIIGNSVQHTNISVQTDD